MSLIIGVGILRFAQDDGLSFGEILRCAQDDSVTFG
jgi:hypothetical protein